EKSSAHWREEGPMTQDTLAKMFWNRVERSGDRPAQQAKRGGTWTTTTWKDVGQSVRELAAGLLALGREAGEAGRPRAPRDVEGRRPERARAGRGPAGPGPEEGRRDRHPLGEPRRVGA